MKDERVHPLGGDETAPASPVDEPPRRVSVSVDSEPMRAASKVEVGEVDAGPASLDERFIMEASLGRGGMGTVQRARDRRLLRDVAVKVIHDHLDWGPHQARFAREAQVTAQLQHPNIVPVYSYERSGEGGAAIVMQLVEGQTLYRYLQDCRQAVARGEDDRAPYDLASRLEILIKVCDAVQYAHDHGVVHRDLKPANVMLGEHGEVYVMDWGLAGVVGVTDEVIRASTGPSDASLDDSQSGPRERRSDGPGEARLTRAGDIFGTPQYMSPEQARGETQRVGPATDQFALGLLLFDVLFLKPPRPGSPHINLVQIAAEGGMDRAEHFADRPVPSALRAVLARATALSIEGRYPSVGHLASDLRRVQRGAPPSVVHESPLQRAWRRFNQNPVRAMRIVLAGVLAAAMALSTTLYFKLHAERRAAFERDRVVELSAGVGERAQHIEDALGEVEALVQGWAKAAEQALTHSQPDTPGALPIDELNEQGEAAGLRYSARHGQAVSYRHASYVTAPEADAALVDRQLGQLAHLTPYLERWLHRGDDSNPPRVRSPRAEQAIPLLWIYIALESGLLVTYPGNVNYPPGYDPRTRPWYRDGLAGGASHWRPPYRSVSGGEIQLPCLAPLVDAGGEPFGVVGVDLALSDLRQRMRLDRDPAWRASWLLDAEGRVLASTALGLPLEPSNDLEGRGVDLAPFDVDKVREEVEDGSAGDVVEVDGTLYVLQRLQSQGWTVVAAFDRERVFDGFDH